MSLCCPICMREYAVNPGTCTCGFDRLVCHDYTDKDRLKETQREELFGIYKFTKRVFLGQIPFPESPLITRECSKRLLIDHVAVDYGLILADKHAANCGMETVADAGMLAFRTNAQALILNTDTVHSDFLDESRVRVLFFGANVKAYRNGFFIPRSPIRYLCVHSDNPNFCSDNNVMFNKDMTRLISYAPARPEEEYRVPESVRTLGKYSFCYPRNLKRLYLPEGIVSEDRALYFSDTCAPEIIYY